MPIYEYFCDTCIKKWESIHCMTARNDEFCSCGRPARLIPSAGAVRAAGINPDMPPVAKRDIPRSQVYDKDGNKQHDNRPARKLVSHLNARADNINKARGHA